MSRFTEFVASNCGTSAAQHCTALGATNELGAGRAEFEACQEAPATGFCCRMNRLPWRRLMRQSVPEIGLQRVTQKH